MIHTNVFVKLDLVILMNFEILVDNVLKSKKVIVNVKKDEMIVIKMLVSFINNFCFNK